MKRFPFLSRERRRELLRPPSERVRVVIDTDAANEIDDQYALTWAVLSPERLDIEAIVAEPYSFGHHREPLLAAATRLRTDPDADVPTIYRDWLANLAAAEIEPADIEFETPAEGMARSYDEVEIVLSKLGLSSDGLLQRGSELFMDSADEPVDSEGARRIVELAMADDDRVLHIVAIGAVTNVASALLLEPEIARRIVVTWTAGYPTWTDFSNAPALNLVQDPHAARLLFDYGVPMVYFPGYHVGAQLRFSLPDVERWVKGKGAIGNYLHNLYINNPVHVQRAIKPFPGQSWVCWDLINVAWLIQPNWVPTRLTPTPALTEDLFWRSRPDAPEMREAVDIDRDAILP